MLQERVQNRLLFIAIFLPMLAMLLSPCMIGKASETRGQGASRSKSSVGSRFLMAHYMPWFEADPAHGRWGWHWTMNHFQPDHLVDGRREAASHYAPLIGLYDSGNPDLLECHVLLMKFAGIDGVMIDWYGTDDYLDYGLIHRNTLRLIEAIKKAGLHFAICYEDQTVPKLIAGQRLQEAEAVTHGQKLLEWMQTNWFTSPAYLKLEDRPVLLVFGGGYYQEDQWKQLFASLPQQPALFTELGRRAPAVGGFGWPVPDGGTEKSVAALESFYTRAKDWPQFIPAAYPRFHDIYQEAEVGKSWGYIDDRGGKTYVETLNRALQSDAAIVQLATWNDWGEGTMIEPSVEYGYRDLEATQRLRRKYLKTPLPYTAQDLRLPVELYALKKRYQGNRAVLAKLEDMSRLLFAGHLDRARALLTIYQAAPH